MSQPIDLAGMQFGRLSVVRRAQGNKDGRAMWVCLCECGNEKLFLAKTYAMGIRNHVDV